MQKMTSTQSLSKMMDPEQKVRIRLVRADSLPSLKNPTDKGAKKSVSSVIKKTFPKAFAKSRSQSRSWSRGRDDGPGMTQRATTNDAKSDVKSRRPGRSRSILRNSIGSGSGGTSTRSSARRRSPSRVRFADDKTCKSALSDASPICVSAVLDDSAVARSIQDEKLHNFGELWYIEADPPSLKKPASSAESKKSSSKRSSTSSSRKKDDRVKARGRNDGSTSRSKKSSAKSSSSTGGNRDNKVETSTRSSRNKIVSSASGKCDRVNRDKKKISESPATSSEEIRSSTGKVSGATSQPTVRSSAKLSTSRKRSTSKTSASSRSKQSTSTDKASRSTSWTSSGSRASAHSSRTKMSTSTDMSLSKPNCAVSSAASTSTPKSKVSHTKIEQDEHKTITEKPPAKARRHSSASFKSPPRREILKKVPSGHQPTSSTSVNGDRLDTSAKSYSSLGRKLGVPGSNACSYSSNASRCSAKTTSCVSRAFSCGSSPLKTTSSMRSLPRVESTPTFSAFHTEKGSNSILLSSAYVPDPSTPTVTAPLSRFDFAAAEHSTEDENNFLTSMATLASSDSDATSRAVAMNSDPSMNSFGSMTPRGIGKESDESVPSVEDHDEMLMFGDSSEDSAAGNSSGHSRNYNMYCAREIKDSDSESFVEPLQSGGTERYNFIQSYDTFDSLEGDSVASVASLGLCFDDSDGWGLHFDNYCDKTSHTSGTSSTITMSTFDYSNETKSTLTDDNTISPSLAAVSTTDTTVAAGNSNVVEKCKVWYRPKKKQLYSTAADTSLASE